tara:strand:+ start:1152 stop:1622 length:471 start_codon:yes stop_codon:yes gene_type:complete
MKKIQVLIDNGFIELNDVLLYAYNHHALEDLNNQVEDDSYYDQMISKYEIEEQLDDPQDYKDRNFYGTEYILASTSDLVEETMVFPSNAEGEITDFGDLACLALRYGNDDWEDAMAAVITLNTDEYKYIHVKTLDNGGNNIHNLFRRINVLETIVI